MTDYNAGETNNATWFSFRKKWRAENKANVSTSEIYECKRIHLSICSSPDWVEAMSLFST